ncbi:MFS transporter [Agrococcus carbonis]|uniref:Transmembrane secretion effector n=1 Tax=Agrococcus carbonis TaxID=684552 RepID=A0A1H1P551_9MICO|nr:MFS transporter [Agrococcus carbonis]SDS06371.1 Transmembrane secretion effector [Agrococcus carbonis]
MTEPQPPLETGAEPSTGAHGILPAAPLTGPIETVEPAAPTEPGAPARKRRFVDLAPLKASPAFARLWIGSAISGIGAQMTIVAVGLQIFDMTGSTMMVALVGGVALLPMVVAGLWGGMLADAFDRRLVLMLSSLTGWAAVLGLVALSAWDAALVADGGRAAVWPFYVLTTLNTVAATISGATRSAVTPRILPAHLISRAAALNGIAIGIMLTAGPAAAGVLVATVGLPVTFAVDAVLFTAGFLGIVGLPKLPPLGEAVRPGLASLRDGVRFMRQAPNIRMSFVVDIIAMTFGRPFALLPAVGAVAIGGGPITVGVLTAAAAVGTLLASLLSGPVAHVHRHGVAVARAITAYGGCVALLGLVILGAMSGWFGPVGADWSRVSWPALALAALALAGMGASDEISAIFRSTMLLTAAPDDMRGRTQGLFTVVVAGGPRIGDLYAGAAASLVALWAPPLFGGFVIIVLIAVVTRAQRTFLAYDARHPTP